ncbi:MAG: hypothetical protein VXZ16_02435 [Bacteroidota bacterium]|nr:hypothetical protein [Bacteroidota bacterium]
MKQFAFLASLLCVTLGASAQFGTAPDFTVTDLGGLEAGNYLIRVSDDVTKVTRRVTLLD